MVTTVPIKVDMEVKEYLEKRKIHPREPFNDVVRRELKLSNNKETSE